MARDVRVNIVGDASRLERELARVDGRMAATGRAAQRMQSVLIGALAGGTLIRGVGAVVKTFAGYDTALREVGAVSGITGKRLQDLGGIARKAGLDTGVGATAATQAMSELAKAGLSASQIGPALKGTLALAQAGGLGTAEAASAAANAMQTFGLQARDTTKIADAFANAANLTTADVGDFAMALTQGGAAAKIAGLSFSDTTLVLTELARIGIKGSDAGTSLKSAFLQLAAPTKAAQGAMEKYNLAFFDHNGKVRDAADISDMLREKLGKLSNQQQIQVLKSIAGTDGFRTLAAMMKVSGAQSDALADKLGRTGSASETAAAKQAGFQGSMNRLKASAQELGISLGERFAPQIAKFADRLAVLANDPTFKDKIVNTLVAFGHAAESAWHAVEPGVELVAKLADGFAGLPGGIQTSVIQLAALSAVAMKLRGTVGMGGAATAVTQLSGGLGRVPAAAKRAETALVASSAAAARAQSKFAMPAVPFADLTGTAKQQAVLARRQAAAAERLAAANQKTLLQSLGGRASGVAGAIPGLSRGAKIGGAAGGLTAALSGQGVAESALSGAVIGSMAGPVGAASGALAGAGVSAIVKVFKGAGSKRAEAAAREFAASAAGNTDRALASGLKNDQNARKLATAQATLASGKQALGLYRQGEQELGSGKSGSVGRGLKLQGKAEDVAKAAGLDLDALRKGTSDAFAKAGREAVAAFSTGIKQNKNTDARALMERFSAAFTDMPRKYQQAGANSMVELARSLEKNGHAPKGTVDRLISQLGKNFDGLTPVVERAAVKSTAAVDKALNDRRLVGSAAKLADRLADQFAQLPRAAVKTVPGAVATLGAQLGQLEKVAKSKNTPKVMKDQADAALPGLRKAYDQALDRMAKRMGTSKDEARDWSSKVARAASRAGDGRVDVDALQAAVARLNSRMLTGAETARAVAKAWRAAGVSAKDAAAAGSGVGAIVDLVGGAIPGNRRGGTIRRFQGGGLVPALVSSGEEIEYGGRSMIVPGPRVAADNVGMMLPVGAKVWTEHGQALRAAGIPDGQALAEQLPHFAKGGVVRGRTSTFGPPGEKAGRTANGMSSAAAGIALNLAPGTDAGWNNDTTNKWVRARQRFLVTIGSHHAVLPMIDKGPAGKTGRAIDVTGAGARKMGINPARFPTDAIGTAQIVGANGKVTADGRVTGGGSIPTKSTVAVRYGKSTTRGGLLDDAYAAGFDAVATFGSRADARRYGNPVGGALREALDAQKDSYTRAVESKLGTLKDSATSKVTKSLETRLKGTAGGGTKLRRLTAALGTMASIAAKGLPYTYGGGHGKLGVGNPGFDCSGYVSAGLGAAGWIKAPMATQQGSGLNTLGASGAGKFLTWGVRGSSGKAAHTMMKIGNTFWESGSGHGPRRVSGWSGKFAYRHMPGYRSGGQVGGRRPAGGVSMAGAPAPVRRTLELVGNAAFNPASENFVGWGFRSGGRVPAFRTGGTATWQSGLTSALGALSQSTTQVNIDQFTSEVAGAALSQVNAMRRDLLVQIRKGGNKQAVDRLRSAVSVIEADLAGRIGEGVAAAQKSLDQFDTRKAKAAHALAMEGVDASSAIGLQSTIETGSSFVNAVAPGARSELVKQREATKREMAKATTKEAKATLAGELTDIRGRIKDLDTTVLGTEEEIAAAKKALPRQLAQERVAGIDLADAMAGLTGTPDDDRAALAARAAEMQRQFQESQARYAATGSADDRAWLTESAGSLKSAADSLRDFDANQKQAGFDFDAAMAALTDTTDDDKDVLQRRAADAEQRLADALARGVEGRADATAAAVDLKGLRDAIGSLDTTIQEQQEREQSLTDALKQVADNQARLLSLTATEQAALTAGFAALVNGSIGGLAAQGLATSFVPGQKARY